MQTEPTETDTRVPLRNRLAEFVQHRLGPHWGILGRAHITLTGSIVGGILGFAAEILCARYLGTQTYGMYAFALVLASAGETISTWGLHVAALRYLSLYRDQNEPRYVLGTIGASLLPPLLIGALLATVLWTLAPMLADRLLGDTNAIRFIRVMALSIPALGLTEVMGYITRGFGEAKYYVVIRNLVSPVAFLVMVSLIAHFKANPLFIAGAFGISYLLAALVGLGCVVRVGGVQLFREQPVFPFAALYAYALPIFLNTVLYLMMGWINFLILSSQHHEEQIGIFRASVQFVMPFTMITAACNAAVGHLYPSLTKHDQRQELVVLVDKTTRWMCTLALGMLLVIAQNRHDLMLLMGTGFRSGGSVLLVLALGQTAVCYGSSAGFLLVLSGRQKVELFNAVSVALLNVVLSVAWIPTHGSIGAAAASSVSCLVISVLRVVEVDRLMGVHTLRLSYIKTLALAALIGLVISQASSYLHVGEGTGTANLAIRMLFTVGVFGIFATGSGLLRPRPVSVLG
jgi:O-antigen/teichoic acid export membrane protein